MAIKTQLSTVPRDVVSFTSASLSSSHASSVSSSAVLMRENLPKGWINLDFIAAFTDIIAVAQVIHQMV